MLIEVLKYIAVFVAAYLIGNFNPAIMISHFLDSDIRKEGSSNPGTMNMGRTYGVKVGVLTLVLDAVKGAAAALLGWLVLGEGEFLQLGEDRIGLYFSGLSVIIGHIYPVFYKFKGGKGIASGLGVLAVANPLGTVIVFALCLVSFTLICKIGSVTSFLCIFTLTAIEGIRFSNVWYSLCLFFFFFLMLFAHRSNIYKLFLGKERKFSAKKKKA